MEKTRVVNKYQRVEDKVIKEFLDAQSPKTRATYETVFKRILDFTNGQSGEEMLRDCEAWNRRIFVFQNWMIEQKYSRNTTQTALGVLRGFFAYYRKQLVFNNQERRKLNLKARNSEDYIFTQNDLKAMSHGTPKQLYVLTCGLSFGLRAEDFTTLTFGDYRQALEQAEQENQVPPIFVKELVTQKELGVKARLFLSEDAVKIVKVLLENNKDAKDNDRVYTSNPEQLTINLQTLFDASSINAHGKRVRFHTLRKILYSALSTVGSEEYAKMIVGKQVNQGDAPYLNPDELRDVYAKAMPKFSVLNGNGTSPETKHKLAELEEENKKLREKLRALENVSTSKDSQNKQQIQQLFSMVEELKKRLDAKA